MRLTAETTGTFNAENALVELFEYRQQAWLACACFCEVRPTG